MSNFSLSRLRCTCWFSASPPSVCYWHQCCGESPHTNGSPEPKAKHSHDQMVLGPKEGFLTVTKAAATSPDSGTRSLIGLLCSSTWCCGLNLPLLHLTDAFHSFIIRDVLTSWKKNFLQLSSSAKPNQYVFLPFKPRFTHQCCCCIKKIM